MSRTAMFFLGGGGAAARDHAGGAGPVLRRPVARDGERAHPCLRPGLRPAAAWTSATSTPSTSGGCPRNAAPWSATPTTATRTCRGRWRWPARRPSGRATTPGTSSTRTCTPPRRRSATARSSISPSCPSGRRVVARRHGRGRLDARLRRDPATLRRRVELPPTRCRRWGQARHDRHSGRGRAPLALPARHLGRPHRARAGEDAALLPHRPAPGGRVCTGSGLRPCRAPSRASHRTAPLGQSPSPGRGSPCCSSSSTAAGRSSCATRAPASTGTSAARRP